MRGLKLVVVGLSAVVSGCAGVSFSNRDDGSSLEYHSVVPAMQVNVDADCKLTTSIISIPGPPRYLAMRSGLGKADTTVDFGAGGIITKINSKTEGQVDDAIKIAKAFGVVAALDGPAKPTCDVATKTYLIEYIDGRPTIDKARPFLVDTMAVPKP